METTEITKEKLDRFVLCAKHYVNNNKRHMIDGNKNRTENVLWIAIDSILPKMVTKLKKVEKEKEFLRLNLCKKTATKHVDLDKNGRYQYTEEDNVTLINKVEQIEKQIIKVPSMLIAEDSVPEEGLTYDMRKAFEGIVIPGEATPELEEVEELEEA